MKIRSFLKESFIDYPGKISSIVFTPRCNYNCPSCHAKHILNSERNILEEDFFGYIDSRKGWIEGVVLCGGEPTCEKEIIDFAGKLKERGLLVKLDTNGSNPKVLEELKKGGLIDYIAMDVKAPPEFYSRAVGKPVILKNISRSIAITSSFQDYEFRTTLCPVYFDGSTARFLNAGEAEEIANYIVGITKRDNHKYFLQRFVPRKGELVDFLLEDFSETPDILIKEAWQRVSKILPRTEIRG